MSLTLDDETLTRLGRMRTGIAREFHRLPEHEVNRRFDQIVKQLLDEATIADFVPVLAWRYSRESLKSLEGVPAEYAASPD